MRIDDGEVRILNGWLRSAAPTPRLAPDPEALRPGEWESRVARWRARARPPTTAREAIAVAESLIRRASGAAVFVVASRVVLAAILGTDAAGA